MGTDSRLRFEIRQPVKGQIHLPGRTTIFVTLQIISEVLRQVFFTDHLHKRQPWINARGNHVRVNLIAVRQDHTCCAAILQKNLCDGRLGANLSSCLARRAGDCV
jgi:hypothetical protein